MKKNILVEHHYYPHYRLPIIKKLSQSQQCNYYFASGIRTNKKIKLIKKECFIEEGIEFLELKNIWITKKILWQRGLIRECLKKKYDVVILHGLPYAITSWIVLVLMRIIKKPVYFWAHAIVRDQHRDILKLIFYKISDGNLLYSHWSKNRLIDLGLDPTNQHVIYNSLDYRDQLRYRNKYSIKELEKLKVCLFKYPEHPVLIFIGRLTKRKKLELLLCACKKLYDENIRTNILFIGDGEERNNLEKISKELGLLDYVHFYGETYDESEIAPLITLADVCVSPGDVGLTAMHSLMYGTPVITHNDPYKQMPEFEAITPDKTGDYFKYDSIDSLAKTIRKWINRTQENPKEIRQACYEIIDQYYNPTYQAQVIEGVILQSEHK